MTGKHGKTQQGSSVKVALKNLHCYTCGKVIPKGNKYVRKEFVKLHYKMCPARKTGDQSHDGRRRDYAPAQVRTPN